MIDFYCNSTGIGDSLLYTQAVSQLDRVILHVPKFKWHGEKYKNKENDNICPIWFNNPHVKEVKIMDEPNPEYDVMPKFGLHQCINICERWLGRAPSHPAPELYLSSEYNIKLKTDKPNLGIFVRNSGSKDNKWDNIYMDEIVDILVDNDINVYQIDAEDYILNSARQDFKQCGVREVCYVVDKMDAVLGSTTGQTHIAKALNKIIFDLWDWKRFGNNTKQVYSSYSYKYTHRFAINGSPIAEGCISANPEQVSSVILRELL